jgi:hypothetical protein
MCALMPIWANFKEGDMMHVVLLDMEGGEQICVPSCPYGQILRKGT